MNAPKVSVCIDVYNYEAFLPEAIESVLRQDFTDFEVIVSDDCSSDNSFEIAREYARKDSRVIALRNEKNLGMVRNRNACLRPATGEYIKVLHADDFLCANDALRKMADVLDANRGVSLVACAMQFIDPASRELNRWTYFRDGTIINGTTAIKLSLRQLRNFIGGPSAVMYRRRKGLRGFDESFFHSADWEMWLHLLEQGCFYYIAKPLCAYRKHGRQQTEKDKLTLTQHADQLALLERYLDKPYLRFPKPLKQYLLCKTIKDFARRSKRLGLPDGARLIKKYGTLKFYLASPLLPLFRGALNFQRNMPGMRRRNYCVKKPGAFSPGVNACGFFKGEYGIGDASRAFYKLIHGSSLPAAFINIHSRDHRNLDQSFADYSERNPHYVNLMTFSFDYARRFYRDQGASFFKHHYNIAVWYWELEKFPARWHPAFGYYDEIWVTTEFCRESFADVSPIPVTKIAYPFFQSREEPEPDREGFGFKKESFLFLFNFDFHSVLKRKNPYGLIAAFKKAFDPKKDDAVLVMKSINAHRYPELASELKRAAAGLNVAWIDEHLNAPRMKQLFATADCYVSLHRSEGLGLGMAQAMGYGKPVIATGYSGNLDFTTPENSLLVKYTLTELDRDYGVYEKGNFWAEPDIGHAAEQMRQVFENREAAMKLGAQARSDIQRIMSPEISFKQMLTRLGEIDARLKPS